ncbi:MAG: hypothetical protein RIS64_3203 [Bacteroidota bacterium]|jgi:hypothetical protein
MRYESIIASNDESAISVLEMADDKWQISQYIDYQCIVRFSNKSCC